MEIPDTTLVQDTLRDSAAYTNLIDRYRPKLLRYIRHLGCRDNQQAEDILQDVFISVYRNLNGYNNSLPFSSWIYRITHNETMSFFRRAKRAPLSLEETAELEVVTELNETDIDSATLHKAIETLDQKYREVIVLKYLEEKSYDEIADILHKPPGTIATLLNRAKQKMKDALKPFHENI